MAPWRYHCDDLIYYAHKLNDHKFLKHFANKEFDPLFKALKQLNDELLFIEPLIHFPTMDVEGESPYQVLHVSPRSSMEEIQHAYQTLLQEKKPERIKKLFAQEEKSTELLEDALEQASVERDAINTAYTEIRTYEQARQAINNFIDTLNRAIYTNTIIEQEKKLLQKYEPEALKIKEEQEKKEATSRKEQEEALKKRPSFVPPIFEPSAGSGYQPEPYIPSRGSNSYTPAYYPPAAPEYQPTPGVTPSTPTPSTPGKKKDEKAKEDKKKDADKKDEKKPGETKGKDEKPKENKKMPEKLITVELRFKDLADYIQNEDPITKIKPMDLFKKFSTYLQTPIAKPYQPDDSEIMKAFQINTALVQITNHIHAIKKEMRTLKDFSTAEKRSLKKSFNDLFEKYKKDSLEKNLKDFFSLPLTPEGNIKEADESIKNVPVEKKYIHFGINEFPDIDAQENDIIKNQNPQKINFIEGLRNALKEMKKEFKEEPKPSLAPGVPSVPTPLAIPPLRN